MSGARPMTDTPRSEPLNIEAAVALAASAVPHFDTCAGLRGPNECDCGVVRVLRQTIERAARQPAADTSGLRAAMRDALSKAHTAKDIDRFLDDYFPFAALSGATPEATAPGLDALARLALVEHWVGHQPCDADCIEDVERRRYRRLTEQQGSGS